MCNLDQTRLKSSLEVHAGLKECVTHLESKVSVMVKIGFNYYHVKGHLTEMKIRNRLMRISKWSTHLVLNRGS